MADRLLWVETTSSDDVPARITRLLVQRRTRITSFHMARGPGDGAWSIQLVVDVTGTAQAELLVKRLSRLIDVIRVVDTGSGPADQRGPAAGKVQPPRGEPARDGELVKGR
jgi:acetolactate synthase small subunit